MDDARDRIRLKLTAMDPQSFPNDTTHGTDIFTLCGTILCEKNNHYDRQFVCETCGERNAATSQHSDIYSFSLFQCATRQWNKRYNRQKVIKQRTADHWLQANLQETTRFKCLTCHGDIYSELVFKQIPQFICFYLNKNIAVKWTHLLTMKGNKYRICGLIYFGSFHFTSRSVSPNGDVW